MNDVSQIPSWVPQLAAFLRRMDEAKAVMWDDDQTELSVATLGSVDEQALRMALEATLNVASHTASKDAVEGLRLRKLSDQHLLEKEDSGEVLATVWTWRRIPWPTPAEAAGIEEGEDGEWRLLAILAGLCGVFGLMGLFVHWTEIGPAWLSPSLYIVAMIAGGWAAAKDAGPNVLRGKLDIHFLMLAVAVGASFIGAFGEGALLLFLLDRKSVV